MFSSFILHPLLGAAMQNVGTAWVVWVVWGMLLTGAGLVVASLWHTSERFWYWKQARQMAAGEVAPAAEALRVGQRFRVLPGEDRAGFNPQYISKEANEALSDFVTAGFDKPMTGQIVGMKRSLLTLLLEPETLTREDEKAQGRNAPVQAGQMLNVQVNGDSELFRFTASVRGVMPDPEQPLKTRVEVKLPLWLARIQRRQHVRASIQAPVTLQTTAEDNYGKSIRETLRGTLRDLSGGGLCLELDGAQRPDTLARLCAQWDGSAILECRLNLPLARETALRLRVHSCERIVTRGGLSLRVRGEFDQIPAWQQETLVSLVFQAQRQQLRQSAPRFQTAL